MKDLCIIYFWRNFLSKKCDFYNYKLQSQVLSSLFNLLRTSQIKYFQNY